MKRERRFKQVHVPYTAVWEKIIGEYSGRHYGIVFKTDPELPEGHEVVSVRDDFERQCFNFLIFHESFEIVPDGQLIPSSNLIGEYVVRPALARQEGKQ